MSNLTVQGSRETDFGPYPLNPIWPQSHFLKSTYDISLIDMGKNVT